VWKFDDVDPEFASMQVKELHQHLQGVLANSAVEVTMGKGYLEVRPRGINQGAHHHSSPLITTHHHSSSFIAGAPERDQQGRDDRPRRLAALFALGRRRLCPLVPLITTHHHYHRHHHSPPLIITHHHSPPLITTHHSSPLIAHVSSSLAPARSIGDDSADEYMFAALQERFGDVGPPQYRHPRPNPRPQRAPATSARNQRPQRAPVTSARNDRMA